VNIRYIFRHGARRDDRCHELPLVFPIVTPPSRRRRHVCSLMNRLLPGSELFEAMLAVLLGLFSLPERYRLSAGSANTRHGNSESL
jgi:hypothetical protein